MEVGVYKDKRAASVASGAAKQPTGRHPTRCGTIPFSRVVLLAVSLIHATVSMDATQLSRARVFVSGKVQGVYYRNSAKLKGEKLSLTGVAYNLKDGRVEIIAEGSKQNIEEFIAWCWKGPEGAHEVGIMDPLTKKRKVTEVQSSWELDEAIGESRKYSEFKNGGKK